MSSYYYNAHHSQPSPAIATLSHPHHGRNRRVPRLSVSQQHAQKQYRAVRNSKEVTESAALNMFRSKFEACRSFDLEDDMEFCPNLLTETDLVSIHSASSERSSLASNSPESSPTQQPQSVAPHFSLNSSSPPFVPPSFHQQTSMKLHQPAATRTRNAIPIINPATGVTMASPPPSISPARMHQQTMGRRW